MTEVLDLYRETHFVTDGNDDFNIEPGERVTEMLLLRRPKYAD